VILRGGTAARGGPVAGMPRAAIGLAASEAPGSWSSTAGTIGVFIFVQASERRSDSKVRKDCPAGLIQLRFLRNEVSPRESVFLR
jgi:hypothetical protein